MFSQRLIALRHMEKLTQKELAARLNIGRGALSLYEIGQREPDLDTLMRMADYFRVSTDYLLGRDAPADAPPLPAAYNEIITAWEKEKRTPSEMREILKMDKGYFELLRQWQAEELSPQKLKEIWSKVQQIGSVLNS